MTSPLRVTLRCEVAELATLRRAVVPYLEQHRATRDTTYTVKLALEEIVSNVMRHSGGASEITVELAPTADGIDLVIEDDGSAFDPLAVAPPNIDGTLEEHPTGGLGIHLVRQMTRSVTYERRSDRNRLTVVV